MPQRTLVKGGFVLSMDPHAGDLPVGDVLIEDGRIAAIAPAIDADAECVDAAGTIVLPGFVDTHRHLWNTTLRGYLPECTVPLYGAKVLGAVGSVIRPEDTEIGELLGALDLLDSGITTVLDWSHCNNGPDYDQAKIGALRESGIRAIYGHGTPAGLAWRSHDNPLPHPAAELRKLRETEFSSDDQLLGLAMAARGPGTTPDAIVERDWALARELGLMITIHCGARWPGSHAQPVQDLERLRLLGPDVNYAHLNETSDADLRLIADSGGTVSISPMIELMCGHGRPPTGRLLAAGLRPTLSADATVNVPGDMFTEMRTALAYERHLALPDDIAADFTPSLTARDVLEFATVDGAAALGLGGKTGSLTVGKQADIIMIAAGQVNTIPVTDPVGTVVTQAGRGNVDSVFVAGRPVKRHGVLLGTDLARLRSRVEDSRDYILGRTGQLPAWLPSSASR
jgi:5-methylthioadenosine/S-adenosylhomocysteine deaminase